MQLPFLNFYKLWYQRKSLKISPQQKTLELLQMSQLQPKQGACYDYHHLPQEVNESDPNGVASLPGTQKLLKIKVYALNILISYFW